MVDWILSRASGLTTDSVCRVMVCVVVPWRTSTHLTGMAAGLERDVGVAVGEDAGVGVPVPTVGVVAGVAVPFPTVGVVAGVGVLFAAVGVAFAVAVAVAVALGVPVPVAVGVPVGLTVGVDATTGPAGPLSGFLGFGNVARTPSQSLVVGSFFKFLTSPT